MSSWGPEAEARLRGIAAGYRPTLPLYADAISSALEEIERLRGELDAAKQFMKHAGQTVTWQEKAERLRSLLEECLPATKEYISYDSDTYQWTCDACPGRLAGQDWLPGEGMEFPHSADCTTRLRRKIEEVLRG